MTDYPGLQVEKRGSTAVVTLSNPPANTWTRDSLDALVRLVDDLEADAGIRTLVLVGEGSKFFCAGADLKLFADGDSGTAAVMSQAFGRAFERRVAEHDEADAHAQFPFDMRPRISSWRQLMYFSDQFVHRSGVVSSPEP